MIVPGWIGEQSSLYSGIGFLGHRFAVHLMLQGGPESCERETEASDGRRRRTEQAGRKRESGVGARDKPPGPGQRGTGARKREGVPRLLRGELYCSPRIQTVSPGNE